MKKKISQLRARGTILSLLLLCFCASPAKPEAISAASELPADVTMNPDAGCGNWLFVTLHLEDGEELPFFIDTAAAATFLDKSLASKLGSPLASEIVPDTGRHESKRYPAPRYPAPKLFLGNVQLKTGDTVQLLDFTNETASAGRRVMGVLGINCLKYYCIQLDFNAGKIRFLDPNHLETVSLGQAFPITFTNKWHQPLLQTGGLVEGIGKPTLLDSGYEADGTLNPGQFAGAVRNGKLITINDKPGWARLLNCVWNGETHSNLIIARADWNAIGLNFLARHLVTLNFPARTMYLKQTRTGSFIENREAASRFLINLKENNQLPGWSKTDHGQIIYTSSNPLTFTSKKNDDSSVYHYTVIRASKDSSWKLQKAWRTDQNDKVIEELAAP